MVPPVGSGFGREQRTRDSSGEEAPDGRHQFPDSGHEVPISRERARASAGGSGRKRRSVQTTSDRLAMSLDEAYHLIPTYKQSKKTHKRLSEQAVERPWTDGSSTRGTKTKGRNKGKGGAGEGRRQKHSRKRRGDQADINVPDRQPNADTRGEHWPDKRDRSRGRDEGGGDNFGGSSDRGRSGLRPGGGGRNGGDNQGSPPWEDKGTYFSRDFTNHQSWDPSGRAEPYPQPAPRGSAGSSDPSGASAGYAVSRAEPSLRGTAADDVEDCVVALAASL